MNAKHSPLTQYTVALILSALVLIGCKKKEPPPPAPTPVAGTAVSTKTLTMPRSQMESHKRLSPKAAANLDQIIEKAHAAQGKVTIHYPANTPKAVLQSLQTFDIGLERDDSSQNYEIIVTKPELPGAR